MRASIFIPSLLLLCTSATPLPFDITNHHQRRGITGNGFAGPGLYKGPIKIWVESPSVFAKTASELKEDLISDSRGTFYERTYSKEPPKDRPWPAPQGWRGMYERFKRKSNVNYVMGRIYDAEHDEREKARIKGEPAPNQDLSWPDFLDKISAMNRHLWYQDVRKVVNRDKWFRGLQQQKMDQFKKEQEEKAQRNPTQYQRVDGEKDPKAAKFFAGLTSEYGQFRVREGKKLESADRHYRNVQAWIDDKKAENLSPVPGRGPGAYRWSNNLPIPGQALFT